jgi:release factor glutamine methyltransferase
MNNKLHHGATLAETMDLASDLFSDLSETARLDAGTLLGYVLGKPRSWIVAHPDAQLDDRACKVLDKILTDVSNGIPLPYIIGHWDFYGLDFIVTRDVLIPRPETELMVDRGLEWLSGHPGRRLAADIGTGSGCIAVSLAVNLLDLKVYASDISTDALQIASQNVHKHGLEERIYLVCGDLLDPLPEPVDAIFANLPYIPTWKLDGLSVARHEPRVALDGGPDGLDLVRRLMAQYHGKVKPGGIVLLEIEAGQGPQAIQLAKDEFNGAEIRCYQDLAGMNRLISIALSDRSDTISASR